MKYNKKCHFENLVETFKNFIVPFEYEKQKSILLIFVVVFAS